MLFQIGPISMDTFPFNADRMNRSSSADMAVKPVISGRSPREFMGPGDDKITISGQLLPTRIGGLTQLEMAASLMNSGQRLPVMRGDGKMFGWYAIETINEAHADLERSGVGFTVNYTISLVNTGGPGAIGVAGIVSMILGLFAGL